MHIHGSTSGYLCLHYTRSRFSLTVTFFKVLTLNPLEIGSVLIDIKVSDEECLLFVFHFEIAFSNSRSAPFIAEYAEWVLLF